MSTPGSFKITLLEWSATDATLRLRLQL